MIHRQITYQEPTHGRDKAAVATLDFLEVEVDGVLKPCITADVGGKNRVAVVIDDEVVNAIYGRSAGIFGNLVGTLLTAKSATNDTTLSVLDDAGFADGDPVAVVNTEGDTPDYHLVSGVPAGNVITLAGSGVTQDFFKGAYVINLKGREFGAGRGFNYQQGVRPQLQAPNAVEIDVDDGAGHSIDVEVIQALTQDRATHFDIYVRDAVFNRVEPNWQPDSLDVVDISVDINVTSFNGSSDCVPDGLGGSLTSLKEVWVAVVPKTGSGQIGVDEGVISNVVHFTLDT